MPEHFFISYATEDRRYVEGLSKALHEAGFSTWFDQEVIPGTNWTDELEQNLLTARAVLVVLTPHSSQSEWVKNEIAFALRNGRLLIPLLRADCQIPLSLSRRQYIDACDGAYPAARIAEALTKLEASAVLQDEGGDRVEETVPPPKPHPTSGVVSVDPSLKWLAVKIQEQRLAVMVGPVASTLAGLPLRDRLVERLRQEVRREDPDCDDLAQLASWYVSKHTTFLTEEDLARQELVKLVAAIYQDCRRNRIRADYGPIYPRLTRLPVLNLYNGNWDRMFEDCLMDQSLERVNSFENWSSLPPPSQGPERQLVNLHGRISGHPEGLLLTSDDFSSFSPKSRNVAGRLQQEFEAGTDLLCLGFSYADLSMVAEYLSRARTRIEHRDTLVYAVFPQISAETACDLARRYRIFPISLHCQPGEAETGLTWRVQFV